MNDLLEMPSDYDFPGLQREYPDMKRPGLVFRVAPGQIWLDPDEIEKQRKRWDEEHSQ
jgi:hypothetical protein